MLRKLKNIFLVGFLLLTFMSCTTETNEARVLTIKREVNLTSVETYTLDLGIIDAEGQARIRTQAQHFELSEITSEINTDRFLYKYSPESNYRGTDFVSIITVRSSEDNASEETVRNYQVAFTIVE